MATKKATAKKATKKSTTKKSTAKKSSAKKSAAKKTATKKTATKKTAAKKTARKYSPSAGKNVETEMKAMKKGQLKSGRSGKKVTDPSVESDISELSFGMTDAQVADKFADLAGRVLPEAHVTRAIDEALHLDARPSVAELVRAACLPA